MGVFSNMSIEQNFNREQMPAAEDAVKKIKSIPTAQRTEPEETKPREETSAASIPIEMTEAEKRKAHDESEAKRKAEWEAKKKAREEAELFEWEKAVAVDDDTLIANSVKRLADATERLTRRNMKLCVTEFVQTKCYEDMAFARQVMHPRKSMLNCFHFINRKAKEYLQQEMKDNEEKPDHNGMYGGDVPDELCYEWAVEYFTKMYLPEDKDENDREFESKPYRSVSTTKTTKKSEKKPAETKKTEPKKESPHQKPEEDHQISLFGLEDFVKKQNQSGEVVAA